MTVSNARAFAIVAFTLSTLLPAPHVGAQQYPTKPIRIIVPLAPGGGNDTVARLVGQKLSDALGQPVIVENRPGGGGVIASEIVARSAPDGYTLYLVSTSFTAAPALQSKLPFDTLRDFAPITRLSTVPGALTVHASMPVKSVRQLLALAKARPGEVTYGSAGIGSGSHFAGELFKIASGVNILHVPYKGSALVTNALLSGEVMVGFGNPISALPHVQSGRLRILGVTSARRWPLLPQFATVAESGVPGYEQLIWNGISVVAGTPQPIVARIHAELARAIAAPDIVSQLSKNGSQPRIEKPEEFAAFLRNEIARWQRVVQSSDIRQN
ncbi:MAG TPA: tripartite tricarboxylate transporter substrate binding protein [Burkholderiales bacterium]|nr:tripartite tricarboxylate transporter substrate binding protein [Burkholderiales bacterium]